MIPAIRKISTSIHATEEGETFAGINMVRELRNVLERATILCDSDTLQENDLPLTIIANGSTHPPLETPPSHPMEEHLDDPAKKRILESLERNRWNKSQTAKDLNISRSTPWQKIKEYSIPNS